MYKSKKIPQVLLLVLSFLGLVDAGYLTVNHFTGQTPFCAIDGCDIVLTSSFAAVGGIPVSLFGVLFYVTIFILSLLIDRLRTLYFLLFLASLGLGVSFVLVYLQLYVIKSICIYCMVSAGITTLIFLTSLYLFVNYRKTAARSQVS